MSLKCLTDLGYKTGNVFFPGVDIEFELPSNKYFRDDGVVDNILEHRKKIHDDLGIGCSRVVESSGFPIIGSCSSHIIQTYGLGKFDISAIYYLKTPDPIFSFTKGHESVHAMINLGLEGRFVEELQKEGFKLNPFKRYSDEETIANVGGLLSLHKRNLLDNFWGLFAFEQKMELYFSSEQKKHFF